MIYDMEFRCVRVDYARAQVKAKDLDLAICEAEIDIARRNLRWHQGSIMKPTLFAAYGEDPADPLAIASQPFYPDEWSWSGADLAKQWRQALRPPVPPLPIGVWAVSLGSFHRNLLPEFSEEGEAEFQLAQLRKNTRMAAGGDRRRRL